MGDTRLVAEGIAATLINGAEHGLRMIGVHEGARAVINGFSGQQHIVRIHNAVYESGHLPACHQFCLRLHDPIKKRQCFLPCARIRTHSVRIVPGKGVVNQQRQPLPVIPGSKELQGADADVAAGNTGDNRAGKGFLPVDCFPGGHRRQRTAAGDAQGVHGLADDVFAQDRPKRRPAVTHPGVGCLARAF